MGSSYQCLMEEMLRDKVGKLITTGQQWKSNSAVHCTLNDYSTFYTAIYDNHYSEHGDDDVISSSTLMENRKIIYRLSMEFTRIHIVVSRSYIFKHCNF